MVIVIIFNINLQLGWLNILGTILIYVALVLTVVSLIDYIAKNKDVLKGSEIDYNREKSMRIIAGTARSLPLKTIEGKDTRPTTDKTKETLFNVMQFDVPGAYFLDLFAGSGQIGLEALSVVQLMLYLWRIQEKPLHALRTISILQSLIRSQGL